MNSATSKIVNIGGVEMACLVYPKYYRFLETSDDGEEWHVILSGQYCMRYVRIPYDQEDAAKRYNQSLLLEPAK